MQVVNVKVAYIRPQYANLREWMADPSNVYCGRRGVVFIDGQRYPPTDSPWANPYKLKDYPINECLRLYEIYIRKKLDSGELDIESLRGKRCGCWCQRQDNGQEYCHVHVLRRILNERESC